MALYQLPSNIYPELNFPRIVVLVHAGDLSPDTMLLTITRPIEEQVSTVLGVRRVRSRTIRGGAEISVFFADNMDMQQALQLVQATVNEARGSLPANTEIEVERLSPTVWPILSLVLNGNVPDADLRDYACTTCARIQPGARGGARGSGLRPIRERFPWWSIHRKRWRIG